MKIAFVKKIENDDHEMMVCDLLCASGIGIITSFHTGKEKFVEFVVNGRNNPNMIISFKDCVSVTFEKDSE